MSIQILPQEQNAAAGIGSGFGKGLAQQLPEEIKRYRLASGLKAAEEGSQGKSLYQNIAALASIPGIDPGLMNTLIPLLQQQGAINERSQTDNPQPINGGSNANTQGVSSASGSQSTPQASQNTTPQENFNPTQALSSRLLQTQRLTYPSPQLADAGAEKILTKGIDSFDKGTTAYLQKEPELQQGEIGGIVRQQLEEKMQQEIANSGGRNPEGIAKKYVQQAYELAKEQRSMRDIAQSWSKPFPPNQSTVESLQKSANRFKEYKIPSDVVINDILDTQNISRGAASYIYDDLKNTPAGKVIYSAPIPTANFDIKSKTFQNREADLAKKLVGTITPDIPMGSLAYIAETKGYDGNKLMAELQRIADPNKLTPQQARDLGNQRMIPLLRSLNEVFLLGKFTSGENSRIKQHGR